ncbi:hypothetical protein [Hymenobacter weizhouensis]|uniref:hypothetical protein n=1 Tax=Hymenobacter sp. YIM 151500-1 TaxID=2987689 RepID=UPI0022275698|nr:hypothetical protein [Hymenobacter sp. YIM 151500-1]UYZ64206.1 hypothetical protein OIS53_04995 [Hymenobacter sp. YIM 151500-1]
MKHLIWGSLLAASLSSCSALFGEEVARLPVNAVSTAGREVVRETSLPLRKDDVLAVWSDMDMAYDGEAPVRFQILVLKNGAPFNQLEIDPTEKNVSVGEVKTSLNGKTNWRFSGKNAEVTIPENATYTFKARLIAANNPTLLIKRAEVVLKK